MKTLKIEIPEGFEIDKMDVKTGTVSFKEIKASYPTHIEDLKRPGYYIDNMSYIKEAEDRGGYTKNMDLNLSDTKEEAEAFLALMQLKRLCNAWNKIDNFVPDFTKWNNNYVVNCKSGKITINVWSSTSFPLAFKSQETAFLFMKKFEDLLETAKPLL